MRIAIYPGTFDPVTAGHLDVMLRSLRVVDKLYVAVATDNNKTTLFNADERVAMIKHEVAAYENIHVEAFSGLLCNFAKDKSASIIIRGLRAISDFEYEFQMAYMNALLDSDLQTIFLPANSGLEFVSSRFVKEVTKLGGDVGNFVSDNVKAKLKAKYS